MPSNSLSNALKTALFAGAAGVILAACGDSEPNDAETPAPQAEAPADPSPTTATPAATTEVDATDITTGGPALWALSDEDTTVYLFGTVHLLKPDLEWRTPEFDAALEASQAIYKEADVMSPEAQAQAQTLVMDLGMLDGETLAEVLDDDAEREVQEALDILGVPMAVIDPMEPWLAGITLGQVGMMQQGYAPGAGVEAVISELAAEGGKELRFFETVEQQMNFFADLPREAQVDFLVSGAIAIEDEPDMLDRLVAEWAEGDVDAIADMMADEDALGSRTVYDVLLTQRNASWIPQIEAILEQPGTYMVAVGAGHLAGDDSVIAMLRAEGYEVTRQ